MLKIKTPESAGVFVFITIKRKAKNAV